MQLNILQYTGQTLHNNKLSKMSVVPRLRNAVYIEFTKCPYSSKCQFLNPTLEERDYCHPRFADEETEAQRNEVACPRSHS